MTTLREAYEAGRGDERAEVVAWLRALDADLPMLPDDVGAALADRIEHGDHAEVTVPGLENLLET